MSRISHSVADGRQGAGSSVTSQRGWMGAERNAGPGAEPSLTREQIRSAMLRGLNRDEQLLLILWYAERMSPAEIAEVLESTEEHVQVIHDHAIAQLRQTAAA